MKLDDDRLASVAYFMLYALIIIDELSNPTSPLVDMVELLAKFKVPPLSL